MREFILLQKIKIREFFNSLNKKKTLSNGISILLTFVLMLMFLFISTMLNISIYQVLKELSDVKIYFPVICSLCLLMLIFTTVTKVKSVLYNSSDYFALKALPLRKGSIVASKIFDVYLSQIKFSFFIISPAIFVVSRYSSAVGVLSAVIIMFLLPVIPILVFGIISVIFGMIFEKRKYSSIVTAFLYILAIVAVYIVIYMPDKNQNVAYTKIYSGMKHVYPLLYWIKGAASGEILPLVYYSLVNIGTLIFTIVIISITFDKINMAGEAKNSKIQSKLSYQVSSNVGKTLFKREVSKITSSTMILVNTIMGPVMSIVIIVIMMLSMKGSVPSDGKDEVLKTFGYISFALSLYMYGISPYSGFAISLEKENLWIVKTSPIEPKDYMKSKINVSYLFSMPFAVITGVVNAILYKMPLFCYFLNPICIILYIIFITKLALYFNLTKPHLVYNNEMEAMKKGSSSFKCLMVSMGAMFIIFASILPFAISFPKYEYVGYIIVLIFEVIAVYIINNILEKKGEALYYSIY